MWTRTLCRVFANFDLAIFDNFSLHTAARAANHSAAEHEQLLIFVFGNANEKFSLSLESFRCRAFFIESN